MKKLLIGLIFLSLNLHAVRRASIETEGNTVGIKAGDRCNLIQYDSECPYIETQSGKKFTYIQKKVIFPEERKTESEAQIEFAQYQGYIGYSVDWSGPCIRPSYTGWFLRSIPTHGHGFCHHYCRLLQGGT